MQGKLYGFRFPYTVRNVNVVLLVRPMLIRISIGLTNRTTARLHSTLTYGLTFAIEIGVDVYFPSVTCSK